MIIDREKIYQLIFRKSWAELLSLVYSYHVAVSSDPTLEQAVNLFKSEFFSQVNTEHNEEDVIASLEYLRLLHMEKKFSLTKDEFREVISALVKNKVERNQMGLAYECAKSCPEDEFCKSVIEKYEASLPKLVAHSQSDRIKVTENRSVSQIDCTRTLFKARQEFEFYIAVREVFQMYVVYPNVALSCVVDFKKIKPHLTQAERDFFFKGIIDCVVFDYHDDLYKPIYFFELDSAYHDEERQKVKDAYKNRIFEVAGKKLQRIRAVNSNLGRTDFVRLVRELA